MRKREGNNLARIGGIGENLLIASHGGVEANLADGGSYGAETLSREHRSIGQDERTGAAQGKWIRSEKRSGCACFADHGWPCLECTGTIGRRPAPVKQSYARKIGSFTAS